MQSVKHPVLGADHGPMYGRWPFRQGTALGIAILVLLAIAVVAMMQHAADGQLPVGYGPPGEYAFAEHCAGCHGDYGYGTDQGPSLIDARYTRPELTRDEFADVIRDGTRGMPAFDHLEPQEIADIIAFVYEVQFDAGL